MAEKAITLTVEGPGFKSTETFMSKSDARAWKEMLESTLAHRDKVNFDLAIYASGLAETVRAHGGPYTHDKWLHVEVPHEQWVKGLPVKLDYEGMFRDVVAGRRLRAPNDYEP